MHIDAKITLLKWIVNCLEVFRDRQGDSKIAMKGYARFISEYLDKLTSNAKDGPAKDVFKKSLESLTNLQKNTKLTQPVFSTILQQVIDDLKKCLEKAQKK